MAYSTKTVLDLPVITDLQGTDKLYLIRGTGVGRDKQAAASVLQGYIGDNLIVATSTVFINIGAYFSNMTIRCNPSAAMNLTITNALPDGKRLIIINPSSSSYTVSLTIEGDTYNVEPGFHVEYISDGTNMQQLNQIAGDLTIDGDLTSIETTNLKVTDKNIEVNVGSTTALTVGAGISILGDSDTEVGYFKVDGSDNSLLTLKAPTGNVITLDINADKELEMSANLTVDADTTISGVTSITGGLTVESASVLNQDLTTDATSQLLKLGLGRDMTGDNAQIKLSIYDPAGGGTLLTFQDVDTGTAYTDGFHIGINDSEQALFNNKEDTDMIFYTSGIERMRLDDSASGALLVKNGISSTDGQSVLKEKILSIGTWNMDITATVSVAHGLDSSKIRLIQALIRRDDSAGVQNDLQDYGAISQINDTYINLTRNAGELFDGPLYDDTGFSRGNIYIKYEV